MAGVHSMGFAGDRAARSALNAVHHFVGLLDVDGTLLEVNTAALIAGGLERDDVVGLPFWEARWWGYDPEVQSTLRDAVRLAASGETVQYPVEVLAADAGRSLVTIDFRLSPVHEADGSISFLVPEGHPLGEVAAGEEDATASLSTLVADASVARNEARDLRDLAAGLAQAYTVDDVASVVMGRIPDVIGVEFCNVAVLDDETSVLIHQPSELDRDVRSRWSRVPIDASSPATDAIRDGRVHVCVDRNAVALRYPDLIDDLVTSGLESIAAVPIVGAEGRAVAAIGLGATTEFRVDLDWARPVLDLCGAALQRAMATQRESRLAALLDTLIRTAPIGFAFVDTELRCTLVNDRLAEVFGSSAGGHAPRSLTDVVPNLADQIVPYVRSVLHDGIAVETVGLAGEIGGSMTERTLTASFYPIHGADRSVTGVGLIVEDTTEQRRQQSELASLAARVRAALAASDGGVYEWHPPTGSVVWTPEYAELYGFADDVEPSFDAWISRVHPDDRDRVLAEVDRFLSDDIEWRHEFRLEHPERGTLWVQSVSDTARDDAGSVVRVTGLNIDITERKERELEIARLHRQ